MKKDTKIALRRTTDKKISSGEKSSENKAIDL